MTQTTAPTAAHAVVRALLGGLALVLALAGNYTLAIAPNLLWLGLLLDALALALFVWTSLRPPPAGLVRLAGRLRLTLAAALAGVAGLVCLLAAALSVAFAELGRENYLSVLVLLAAGAVLYVASFARPRRMPARAQVAAWLKAHRAELGALALIVALAAGVRFYRLGDVPRVINGDEGRLGQAAVATRELPLANPFALYENFGGLYMQAIGLAVRVFGRTPLALRLTPALGGLLAVAAIFLLGRRLFGPRTGLLAAFLLAVSHAHIHFSRTVAVAYIQETWISPLVVYFFVGGLQRRSAARMAAGGVLLGGFFSVYLGAQILAAFLVVFTVVAAAVCRPLVRHTARLQVVFWLGVFLLGLPQALYSLANPDEFLARLNADGTFQSGWLAAEVARSGHSVPVILLGRVGHAFLALIHFPALEFYGAYIPLLEALTGALFLFGLGCALLSLREARYLLLNGWFWSAVLAVGIFAIPPAADSYRMLIALPAAMLLAAVGWRRLLRVLAADGPGRRGAWLGASALLVAAIATLNLRAYYVDFAGNCRFGGDVQTRFASYLGSFLHTVSRDENAYLLSTPDLRYGTHSSVDFLGANHPVTNVDGPAAGLQAESLQVVVAVAERADELRAWARRHPGGAFQDAYDCQRLVLLAYRLP